MITVSPAKVVAKHLVAAGAGVYGGPTGTTNSQWPIFFSFEPKDPANVITCFDTGADFDGRLHNTGEDVAFPTVQVRIRSASADDGYAKGRQVQGILNALRPSTLTSVIVVPAVGLTPAVSVLFLAAHRKTDLTLIAVQENDMRRVFVCNYRLTLKEP